MKDTAGSLTAREITQEEGHAWLEQMYSSGGSYSKI